MMHSESRRFEHWVRSAREALDPVSAAAASAEGQKLSLDEAVAYALDAYSTDAAMRKEHDARAR
jgi:hypothetical protein